MSQSTTCPNCSKRFAARAQAVGRRVKCPKCTQPFVVRLDSEAEEPPTIDDLAAVAAMTPEPSWQPPVVASQPARAPIRLNPKLLWGGGGGLALAAVALVVYCMWPTHVETRKTSIAAAVDAMQGPPPANMVVDPIGETHEPGRPTAEISGGTYQDMVNGFGADWVVRVFVTGSLKPDITASGRNHPASYIGSFGASRELEPAMVTWAANQKAVEASISVGCDTHIRFPDNSQLITGPLHDINRLVNKLIHPKVNPNAYAIDREGYYLIRLSITPESVTVDPARRTVTIDLSKVAFRADTPASDQAVAQFAGSTAAPDSNTGTARPADAPSSVAAPDPQPAEPGGAAAADATPLKQVLHSYLVAVETYDAAGLKVCLFNIEPEFLDLQSAAMTNVREMEELGAAKFAASPRPHPRQPKSVAELAAQANQDYEQYAALPFRVTGDSAFLRIPGAGGIKFKKIDGQWKIDGDVMFKDPSPENKRRDLLIYRVTLKVREQLKQELADGKFKDWPMVEQAVRNRLSKALAADPEYQQADKALADARSRAFPAPGPQAPASAVPGASDNSATVGRTALAGGEGGSDVAPTESNGNPVLGFRYVFGNWAGHQVFQSFDPLFELPAAGKAGADAPGTKTILPRAGYVVGGLIVASDEVSPVAIRVMFVRSKNGAIDARDTYTSAWLGDPGKAHQQQLAGAGEKVIGTFGHKGFNVNAIGLLIAPAAPASRSSASPSAR